MTEAVPLTQEEVDTFLTAVEWLLGLVGAQQVANAWSSPSALSRYTTGGLAAHGLSGSLLRLHQVVRDPAPDGLRRITVADAFGPNRMDGPDDDDPLFVTLRTGSEQLAERGPAGLLETCVAPLEALRTALPQCDAERGVAMVRVPDGQLSLRDFLRTRVLEAVVHGDDLVASIPDWEPPEPPAAAVEVSLGLCFELAVARVGGLTALRAFTRGERAEADALRVL